MSDKQYQTLLARRLRRGIPKRHEATLDDYAAGTMLIPGVGDVTGLAADAKNLYDNPEERTPLNFALAGLGALPFVPSMSGALRAFHASPHDFDKFDSAHLGKGEGRQDFGQGHYLAESEDISGKGGHYDKKFSTPEKPATIYEVEADVDVDKMLDWDKPLGKQSSQKKLKDALNEMEGEGLLDEFFGGGVPEIDDLTGREAHRLFELATDYQYLPTKIDPGLDNAAANTAQILRDMDVPGVKYLDGASRKAGEGANNYVIFNDDVLRIAKKYGIAPAAVTAAMLTNERRQEPDS